MRRTGSALAFICSPRPSRARTAAPPLIWIPPPMFGLSSSRRGTATSSTPVSNVRSARASASPPIPAPTTAMRFGGGASMVGEAAVRGVARIDSVGTSAGTSAIIAAANMVQRGEG
eukprot:scaffold400_cov38-Phaeocystis_antarctica.AAC.1